LQVILIFFASMIASGGIQYLLNCKHNFACLSSGK